MAIRTLVYIAKSPKAPEGARVLAANSLLDRGWGKAEQSHVGVDGGAIQVVFRHIVESVNENNELVIIDAEPTKRIG
jgi:hypothetical protein